MSFWVNAFWTNLSELGKQNFLDFYLSKKLGTQLKKTLAYLLITKHGRCPSLHSGGSNAAEGSRQVLDVTRSQILSYQICTVKGMSPKSRL